MFRSVDNRYFQSQNRIAKCLHLWHFWFVLSNPEDKHGWPPREFFMVDGIGSPHSPQGVIDNFPENSELRTESGADFPVNMIRTTLGNDVSDFGRREGRGGLRRVVPSGMRMIDCEVRCLVLCLKPDTSADNVCIGDKQFFGPGEVLQFIRHWSDPSNLASDSGGLFPSMILG